MGLLKDFHKLAAFVWRGGQPLASSFCCNQLEIVQEFGCWARIIRFA